MERNKQRVVDNTDCCRGLSTMDRGSQQREEPTDMGQASTLFWMQAKERERERKECDCRCQARIRPLITGLWLASTRARVLET